MTAPDPREAVIARVEAHPVRNVQTRVITGYMLPADEWREIRASIRATATDPDEAIEAIHREAYPGAGWCAGCHDSAAREQWPCVTILAARQRPTQQAATDRAVES